MGTEADSRGNDSKKGKGNREGNSKSNRNRKKGKATDWGGWLWFPHLKGEMWGTRHCD